MVFGRRLTDDCSMSQNSSFGRTPDNGDNPDLSGNAYGINDSGPNNAWASPDSDTSFQYNQYSGNGNYHSDPVPGAGEMSAADDKTFAILAALSIPVGLLVSLGWLGFVGPLVIWLIYRDRSPFVREAAVRAFNFQLGMTIASVIAWVLFFTIILIPVAIIIWIGVFILSLYYPIRATMAATEYRLFSYPFSLSVLS